MYNYTVMFDSYNFCLFKLFKLLIIHLSIILPDQLKYNAHLSVQIEDCTAIKLGLTNTPWFRKNKFSSSPVVF